MSALQQEQYTLLSRAPFTLGAFSLAAYKAREGIAGGSGTTAGRVVLLRQLDVAPAAANEIFAASQIYASLPADPHILRHYGLITVDDSSAENSGLEPGVYAISEWAQGITLDERIRRVAPFSLSVAVITAIEVAQALVRAEAFGIEHGNLTADEVFITSDGIAKVADFVLAKAVSRSAGASGQASRGGGDGLSACAALLFEMLTGKQPARYNSPLEPQRLERSVPNALNGITQKASLGRSRNGYASIAEMLADLQAVREELRLGRSLDWTPLDSQAATSFTETAPATEATMLPPLPSQSIQPSALTGETARPRQIEAENISPPMSNTPRTTETESTQQQIPPARISNPVGAGGDPGGDYDDYEPPRSRASSVLRGIGIILGSLAIIAIVFACVYFALLVNNVPSDITVPPLIGKQYTDAKTLAAQQHFSLMEIGHTNSDQWPQGAIYQQTPESGRMIKSGKDVNVFVSDGPRLLDVPDLSQTTQEKAEAVLQDAGLPLGSVEAEYDNIVPKGIVTAQQPVANSKVSRDQAINLTVSKGPPPPTAPTNLSATCTVEGEIDLSWDQVPIATTYDIYRDGKKIQSGFPETEYSDVGLDTTQTHIYTITAVDANGESPASQPASAVAQPGGVLPVPGAASDSTDGAQTSQPDDPDATPQAIAAPTQGAPKQRQFHVQFHVPRGTSYTHNVQIQVQDATGTNVAYNQDLSRGDLVDQQVQGFGNRIIVRIFIDSKLVKQVTK